MSITGEIGILNVGAGDTKLVFDKSNPAECIRAARIVTDMLRRGYALLVEVSRSDGSKVFQRVYEFKEESCEYVIADLDPVSAEKADKEEAKREQAAAAGNAEGGEKEQVPRRVRRKSIPASTTRAVAVARSAGG